MRSQDWKARNAPDGPQLIIRCKVCKKPLFTLERGLVVVRKSTKAEKRDVKCIHDGCSARNILWVEKGI